MCAATFDLVTFLLARQVSVLRSAEEALTHTRLTHYEVDGQPAASDRLRALLDVVVRACATHRLDAVLQYADELAAARHSGGFALAEVQTAINVLEEAVWRSITSEAPVAAQSAALATVSAVLGAVKDRLACDYVTRAADRPAAPLRLDLLFAGFEGDAPVSMAGS